MGLRPATSCRCSMRASSTAPPASRAAGLRWSESYQAATARYARLIASHLGSGVTVDAVTLDALERDPVLRQADRIGEPRRHLREPAPRGRGADARHAGRRDQLHPLGGDAPRARLARVRSRSVGIVSRVPEFLPDHDSPACSASRRMCRRRPRPCSMLASRTAAIAAADVIVYATGAEADPRPAEAGHRRRSNTATYPIRRTSSASSFPLIRRPPSGRAATCKGSVVKIGEMNWSQVERYLKTDDRAVLPLGSTEQHAGLSLSVDSILSERVALEAAEPLGVPVFPVLAYGDHALFSRLSGQRQPPRRDLCAHRPRHPRQPEARRLPQDPHRQRPWRQPAGAEPGDRVDGRQSGLRDQVPQLVERAENLRQGAGDRSRRLACLLDGEFSLDAAEGRRASRAR